MLTQALMVAIGGGLGALLRWQAVKLSVLLFGTGFPFGTLLVNAVGSFLMGLAAVIMVERGIEARFAPLIMTGILGGFTTFSAFSLDAAMLMERGREAAALVYAGGSVLLSLCGVSLGLWLARALM